MTPNITGLPGQYTGVSVTPRHVFLNGDFEWYRAGGIIIDGTASRDPSNSNVNVLRPGLVMGKITSSGKMAPSIFGVLTNAEANGSTQLEASAAVMTEIARRIGSSGTVKVTGPPTANGTVRTITATYSAISSTNMTITAMSANEVQTLTFGAAATGGTLRLRVPKADGTFVTTGPITWDTTDATYLSNINTALDAATGVTGGIVATGAAPDTALTFTFSGTGYAGLPQPTEMISVHTFPTSTTTATVVRTTTGVDGRFVAGSFLQPTDGSESPVSVIGDGSGINVFSSDGSTAVDQPWPKMPISALIESGQLLPAWPSDTSLRAWLVSQLNANGGNFLFSHKL